MRAASSGTNARGKDHRNAAREVARMDPLSEETLLCPRMGPIGLEENGTPAHFQTDLVAETPSDPPARADTGANRSNDWGERWTFVQYIELPVFSDLLPEVADSAPLNLVDSTPSLIPLSLNPRDSNMQVIPSTKIYLCRCLPPPSSSSFRLVICINSRPDPISPCYLSLLRKVKREDLTP